MRRFRDSAYLGVAFGGLMAIGAGCSSEGSGGSGAPASPADSGTGAATAPAPATASAAATAKIDYDSRELLPFELDKVAGEFGPTKPSPEQDVALQKVFRQLAGGLTGYCGAHINGPILCWGETPISGMSGGFVQAAMGDKFGCGLDTSGKVKCSPESAAPELGAPSAAAPNAPAPDPSAEPDPSAPAEEVKFKSIYAGPNHVCGLDAKGNAVCAGSEGACSLPPPPAGVSFRSLAVGSCHVCGRDSSGAVSCWAPEGTAAAKPPEGLAASDLASGDGYSCAIDAKGALVCWGTAPKAPADLPAELKSVGARGGTVCAIAKSGALRCFGATDVNKPGPYTGVVVASESACANVSKDRLECFGSESHKQLEVPIDTSLNTVLDAGRTPDEQKANKKRRSDTFGELLAKFKEREAPIKVERTTKLPVGRVVEEQYQPVLDLVNFNVRIPDTHYHYGFAIKAPDKKFRLLLVHERDIPTLMSFNDEGKRMGKLALAGYKMTDIDPSLFDCGDVKEEVVTESEIGADLKITVKTTTVLESLGRLKNKEGKIQNYCKVTERKEVFMVAPTGKIDKFSSNSDTVYDKIADEACRGRWLKNPRSDKYTASDSMPHECECRTGRAVCN